MEKVIPNENVVFNVQNEMGEFREAVKTTLKKDIDYGIIPHAGDKPTLYKAGAEKIIKILNLQQYYEFGECKRDFENGFFYFEIICTLSNDTIHCTGVGSCNSAESKYAKQNPYTLANTILKMARKRAMVDAALSASGLSDLFTQDVEDLDFDEPKKNKTNKKEKFVEKPDEEEIISFDEEKETEPTNCCSVCGVELSEKVNNYSVNKFGTPLCYKCQKGVA